jgi:hypothetical protein
MQHALERWTFGRRFVETRHNLNLNLNANARANANANARKSILCENPAIVSF